MNSDICIGKNVGYTNILLALDQVQTRIPTANSPIHQITCSHGFWFGIGPGVMGIRLVGVWVLGVWVLGVWLSEC